MPATPHRAPGPVTLVTMVRKLVLVTVVALIGVAAFVLLAPLAPDESWINEAGTKLADAMKAWWGNPIAP